MSMYIVETDVAGMIYVYVISIESQFVQVLNYLLPNMEAKVAVQGEYRPKEGTNRHLFEIKPLMLPNYTHTHTHTHTQKWLLSPPELSGKRVKGRSEDKKNNSLSDMKLATAYRGAVTSESCSQYKLDQLLPHFLSFFKCFSFFSSKEPLSLFFFLSVCRQFFYEMGLLILATHTRHCYFDELTKCIK